jgi:molecular chaperone IbpA
MASRFSPLQPIYLGYDPLFFKLDSLLDSISSRISGDNSVISNYPPIDIFKEQNGYTINLAIAGFKKSQITVTHDKELGVLSIMGNNAPPEAEPPSTVEMSNTKVNASEPDIKLSPKRVAIKQGIANRTFNRNFHISSELEVISCTMAEGLLTICLMQKVKPIMSPVKIDIN